MEDIFQNIDMTIVELKKLLDKNSNLRLEVAKMEMKVLECYKPVILEVLEQMHKQKSIDHQNNQRKKNN
ncbi:hypothetical protein HCN44_005391 [Aphidius gifuensis]|uniref:Uncharacterized protein n=1 Tax=Aphidius gifuensis TaxID=684658 RepID=A0A835CVD3_APHGI|nr:hypothetical protein HCN44_005391 [Aphidius gifuensis]